MAFLQRELTERIKASSEGKICLIAGPRQAGKSSLLASLHKNRSLTILSGDHPLAPARLEDPAFLASLNGKECLLIDEVQRIPNVGAFLNRLRTEKIGCRIFATASSEEAVRQICTAAPGFCRVFNLWPLSLRETAVFSSREKALELIPKRLVYGSYPEVAANPRNEEKVLGRIIELHLLKDVLIPEGVRNRTTLLRLLKLLALRMGREISFEALSREAGLSKTTLIRYLRLLEDSYIIKILPSFSQSHPSELRKGKKIFFVDLGIRNAILEDFRSPEAREDADRLWQNFFLMEKIKNSANACTPLKMYFWRTTDGAEMDFIEEGSEGLKAFQCRNSEKMRSKIPKVFRSAYPDIPVDFVSVLSCEELLSF